MKNYIKIWFFVEKLLKQDNKLKKGFLIMTNYIYVAQSLDGFIATKDGGVDWLNEIPRPEGEDFGFAEFMDDIDAILMGKNTYETVLSFGVWPYEKPVFVLSNSISDVPDHLQNKAKIVSGDLSDVLQQLNQQGYNDLYIDGGKLIQSSLQQNLIDALIITTIPILLGEGISLFAPSKQQVKLVHKQTKILNNQLVKSHYKMLKT